jgi:hypothetical protein
VTLGSALAAVLLVAVSMFFTWYVAELNSLQSNLWLETGVLIGTDRDHQW